MNLPATDHRIRRVLFQDVLELTAQFDEATRVLVSVRPHIVSGVTHSERIKKASNQLSIARKKLMKAHRRLGDYFDHGIVPEDLKRSG